jgi:uncharacterized membrane protein
LAETAAERYRESSEVPEMANVSTHDAPRTPQPQPGIDLRWPAAALWRPGEPLVRTIGVHDVKDALRKGFDDFSAMPSHAIFLCLIYPIAGLVLYRLVAGYDMLPMIYPITVGFALLGPLAAIGLYELSRRRELGLETSVARALDVLKRPSIGAIVRLGIVLAAIFFAWLYAAQTIYHQLFGPTMPTSFGAFVDQIVSTAQGRQLAIAGNAVGLLFAAVVLVISVVSFPMLVDRDVSAATAVRTSIRASLANPVPIGVWGIIVVALLVLGALPLLMGLALVLPVLGHATWHLYRKLIVTDGADSLS